MQLHLCFGICGFDQNSKPDWIHFKNDYANKRRRLLYSPSPSLLLSGPQLQQARPQPTPSPPSAEARSSWRPAHLRSLLPCGPGRKLGSPVQMPKWRPAARSIPPLCIVHMRARLPLYSSAQSSVNPSPTSVRSGLSRLEIFGS